MRLVACRWKPDALLGVWFSFSPDLFRRHRDLEARQRNGSFAQQNDSGGTGRVICLFEVSSRLRRAEPANVLLPCWSWAGRRGAGVAGGFASCGSRSGPSEERSAQAERSASFADAARLSSRRRQVLPRRVAICARPGRSEAASPRRVSATVPCLRRSRLRPPAPSMGASGGAFLFPFGIMGAVRASWRGWRPLSVSNADGKQSRLDGRGECFRRVACDEGEGEEHEANYISGRDFPQAARRRPWRDVAIPGRV